MSASIKAIETRYAGCRFRSRLEARWAVFLDALGVPWEYELQGYELAPYSWGGEIHTAAYLPDFWLPWQTKYLEVKGINPPENYRGMLGAFAAQSGKHVLLAIGSLPAEIEEYVPSSTVEVAWAGTDQVQWYWDCCREWVACPACGYQDATFSGYVSRLRCGCLKDWEMDGRQDRFITDAYAEARSARFEYGESPPSGWSAGSLHVRTTGVLGAWTDKPSD